MSVRCQETDGSSKHLTAIKTIIDNTNTYLQMEQAAIAAALKESSNKMKSELDALTGVHTDLESALAPKIADLQKAGLAASVADLKKVVDRRGQLSKQINQLDQSLPDVTRLRKERGELLSELTATREETVRRRKDQ
ncbi:MAG: hypothetical protein JWN44_7005, partial [Myxococcales bacterium]|nr:hypothetical protein [Myxococcales bacterium]